MDLPLSELYLRDEGEIKAPAIRRLTQSECELHDRVKWKKWTVFDSRLQLVFVMAMAMSLHFHIVIKESERVA